MDGSLGVNDFSFQDCLVISLQFCGCQESFPLIGKIASFLVRRFYFQYTLSNVQYPKPGIDVLTEILSPSFLLAASPPWRSALSSFCICYSFMNNNMEGWHALEKEPGSVILL